MLDTSKCDNTNKMKLFQTQFVRNGNYTLQFI